MNVILKPTPGIKDLYTLVIWKYFLGVKSSLATGGRRPTPVCVATHSAENTRSVLSGIATHLGPAQRAEATFQPLGHLTRFLQIDGCYFNATLM